MAPRPAFFCAISITISMAWGALGCGSDADCATDTDCPVFQRCEANACVRLGGGMDAGAREGGVVGDAGPRDAAPAPDAPGLPDSGPATVRSGTVGAQSNTFMLAGSTLSTYAASAQFSQTPGTPSGFCVASMMAECAITTCAAPVPMDAGEPPDAGPPEDAGEMDASAPRAPSSGAIMVTGGSMDITLMPAPDGTYTPVSGASALWAGGEMLTYSSVGAEVPAFSGMIAAPPRITVIAPSFGVGAGGMVSIDRSMPLVTRWTGGSTGATAKVIVFASGMTTDGGTINASCSFNAPAGEGTIPVAVLGMFAAGAGSFSVSTSTSMVLDSGGWMVTISAGGTGARMNGLASGAADFM